MTHHDLPNPGDTVTITPGHRTVIVATAQMTRDGHMVIRATDGPAVTALPWNVRKTG